MSSEHEQLKQIDFLSNPVKVFGKLSKLDKNLWYENFGWKMKFLIYISNKSMQQQMNFHSNFVFIRDD